MILTVNQLEEVAPILDYRRAELILPNFNATCLRYEINNPYRVAHFLTQVIVESNYFRIIQEPGKGLEYEGNKKLGNIEKGDGRRFIGRGYLRIVGRSEYEEYRQHSRIDVVTYPHYTTTPKVAMDIAGWLWVKKNLNSAADLNDLEGITKTLLGVSVYLRERQEIFDKVRRVMIKSNLNQ